MKKNQEGQSLVLLLFFVLMAMTFTITALLTSTIASGSIVNLENGVETRQLADSGAENALLKLIRDPSYSGESYTVGSANIVITVTNGTTKTVVATSTLGDFTRTVEVLADYTDNVLTITSWREVF